MSIFPNKPKVEQVKDPHNITTYHIFSSIMALFNVMILSISWLFHMIMMFTTTPKNQWFNPLDRKNWVTHEYSHWYCNFLCNVEEIMLHQMHRLRHDYGSYWCEEEILNTENIDKEINN